MGAKVKAKPQIQEAPRPLTRRVSRRPAFGLALVQSNHGDRAKARLRDISAYGCNLVVDATWLRLGLFVAIRPSSDRSIQAIVRWVRDGACGVEFLRPITDAEAEAIGEGY